MSIDDAYTEHDTVLRLAALLEAEQALTVEALRWDFPGWLIWRSDISGRFHARRDDPSGRYQEVVGGPHRFALAADTLGPLAVLLLVQTMLDADPEA